VDDDVVNVWCFLETEDVARCVGGDSDGDDGINVGGGKDAWSEIAFDIVGQSFELRATVMAGGDVVDAYFEIAGGVGEVDVVLYGDDVAGADSLVLHVLCSEIELVIEEVHMRLWQVSDHVSDQASYSVVVSGVVEEQLIECLWTCFVKLGDVLPL